MSMNETEMVEELASLINNKSFSTNLVLSVEEALVEFLKDDNSSYDILELGPMNAYDRFLVHRLADTFQLNHESIGEGYDRHLILERCHESKVPPVLVRDILLQGNNYKSPATSRAQLHKNNALQGTSVSFICRYNGVMEAQQNGKAEYIGGETKMRNCSINTSYNDFVKILEEVSRMNSNNSNISFRYYVSGYACKVDGVSDYSSMINKHKKNPSEQIVVWIFKEEAVKEPVLEVENKEESEPTTEQNVEVEKEEKEPAKELNLEVANKEEKEAIKEPNLEVDKDQEINAREEDWVMVV